MHQSPNWVRPVAIVAAVFGIATVFSGGTALFGGAAAKAAVGDAVPLVLWFNFFAGFVYVLGAFTLMKSEFWAQRIAWLIAVCTLFVFAILIAMAVTGTPFEWRTIGAMTLRSGFWLVIAIALSKIV
ncbi:hypothetical protein [Ruegeria lacuscaerulensis]|uniref:hypothetical protein n=1 Tax=Ruegeria lacuscaerulensis TaxID=55218 RepID=UPI0014804D68|nr:hypothetical protein [Ruegeria lacuscaerulensis]